MPVSRQRQLAYPGGSLRSPEWLAIRAKVLEWNSNACAICRVPNGQKIARGTGKDKGTFLYMGEQICVPWSMAHRTRFSYLDIRDENNGAYLDEGMDGFFEHNGYIKIVLTIAHLDHDPTNNDPSNMAALCQLHHNRHDAKHRAATRRMRMNGDLFLDLGAHA